jgi:hypothetical protein
MAESVAGFLDEWHGLVAARDLDRLRAVLADDVSLGAPPYWNRLHGREIVHHLLGLIIGTVERFTYHREWQNGRELALEFTGSVDGLELQGIDLIRLDASYRVQRLDVMIRPINAVLALRDSVAPRMADFLARRGAGAASR